MRYRFGGCCLDLGTRELRCVQGPVDLEPRTFAVLELLIRHRDRVVPKEELLDEVWGDRFVSESALTTQIKYARQAVGDDGRSQAFIKTVHGTGYRFVADVEEEAGEPAARAAAEPAPGWIPPPTARLFGRDEDLETLAEEIATHRVVTIVGPGGIGKTAVARHLLAADARPGPSAAGFCELANTRDASSVASVVLAAIDEVEHGDADPVESLLRTLEDREMLLVLDNCEHVLAPTRDLTLALLRACPRVRVLATSTVPLAVDSEMVHPLAPLQRSDAVACFVTRAAEAGSSVDPDDPALEELCRRLDGVPLAIELAAARSRMLSPAEMLELLTDRFRLLRGSAAGRDDRHQSLHATIAWSWEALSPEDRQLLARLGVFVGSFTLDDARAVALDDRDPLDAVDALGRLVSASFLIPVPTPTGRTRFRMLESIREFATERLHDVSGLRRAHAHHHAALAESLDAACQTPDVDDALASMRAAWDNLRAAVGYAADADDITTVRRIIRAVGGYVELFQLFEVLHWCEQVDLEALPDDDGELPLAADALAVKAAMLVHRGEQDRGCELAARAHARHESYSTLLAVLFCAYYTGDFATVVGSTDRLLELSRGPRGLERGLVEGLASLLMAAQLQSDIESTALTPADAERGVLGLQSCLTEGLRLFASDPARSTELLEAVVEVAVRKDYRLPLAAAASALTQLALPHRPPEEAMRTLRRTLQMYRDRSMWRLVSADTVMAAKLLAEHDDPDTACRLLGARVASGYATGYSEIIRMDLQQRLEEQLGDRAAELAAQGAGWRPPEAAEVAISTLSRTLGEPAKPGT